MAPDGTVCTAEEIVLTILFQKKYYHTAVRSIDGSVSNIPSLLVENE